MYLCCLWSNPNSITTHAALIIKKLFCSSLSLMLQPIYHHGECCLSCKNYSVLSFQFIYHHGECCHSYKNYSVPFYQRWFSLYITMVSDAVVIRTILYHFIFIMVKSALIKNYYAPFCQWRFKLSVNYGECCLNHKNYALLFYWWHFRLSTNHGNGLPEFQKVNESLVVKIIRFLLQL